MWEYKRPEKGFLGGEERLQVAVLMDGILPPGATNPGASDANVVDFLDFLLADPTVYYEIATWRSLYKVALPWLSTVTQQELQKDLQSISPEECAELLTSLAAGTLVGAPAGFDQKGFFNVLRGHCIEGCFSDQRWGGNQENVIWQWYGYPTGPASSFDRTATSMLRPYNSPPDGVAVLSGNTATAVKDTLLGESATVLPLLLSEAVNAQRNGAIPRNSAIPMEEGELP